MKKLLCLLSIFIIGCGSEKSKNETLSKGYELPIAGEYREYYATEGDLVRVKFPNYKDGVTSGYGKVFDFYRRDKDAGFTINELIKAAYYSFETKVKDSKWPSREECLENIKCNEIKNNNSKEFRSYIADRSNRYITFLNRTFFFDVQSEDDNFTTKFALKIECTSEIEAFDRNVYCKEDQYKIKLKIFEFKEL